MNALIMLLLELIIGQQNTIMITTIATASAPTRALIVII